MSMDHEIYVEGTVSRCVLEELVKDNYCKSGTFRENLIFANIREFDALRIQGSR